MLKIEYSQNLETENNKLKNKNSLDDLIWEKETEIQKEELERLYQKYPYERNRQLENDIDIGI